MNVFLDASPITVVTTETECDGERKLNFGGREIVLSIDQGEALSKESYVFAHVLGNPSPSQAIGNYSTKELKLAHKLVASVLNLKPRSYIREETVQDRIDQIVGMWPIASDLEFEHWKRESKNFLLQNISLDNFQELSEILKENLQPYEYGILFDFYLNNFLIPYGRALHNKKSRIVEFLMPALQALILFLETHKALNPKKTLQMEMDLRPGHANDSLMRLKTVLHLSPNLIKINLKNSWSIQDYLEKVSPILLGASELAIFHSNDDSLEMEEIEQRYATMIEMNLHTTKRKRVREKDTGQPPLKRFKSSDDEKEDEFHLKLPSSEVYSEKLQNFCELVLFKKKRLEIRELLESQFNFFEAYKHLHEALKIEMPIQLTSGGYQDSLNLFDLLQSWTPKAEHFVFTGKGKHNEQSAVYGRHFLHALQEKIPYTKSVILQQFVLNDLNEFPKFAELTHLTFIDCQFSEKADAQTYFDIFKGLSPKLESVEVV